jgi:hypothetical protein
MPISTAADVTGDGMCPTAEDAAYLQRAAWETVLGYEYAHLAK